MKSKLILTADDFGACDFIDNGIRSAIEGGAINCVSAFVTHESSRDRIEKLLQWRKDKHLDFQVGLHFSITSGIPITRAEGMKEGSRFKELSEYDFSKVNLSDLESEIKAQYNYLAHTLDKFDMKVDHINNHHNVVYFFDYLFDVFSKSAAKLSVPVRSPIPWSKTNLNYKKKGISVALPVKKEAFGTGISIFIKNLINNNIKDKKVKNMLKSQKPVSFYKKSYKLAHSNVLFPFCFCDTIYGQPSVKNIVFLINELKEFNVPVEFMFHLGDTNQNLKNINEIIPIGINEKYFSGRSLEAKVLQEINMRKVLNDSNIDLITYKDLKSNFNIS